MKEVIDMMDDIRWTTWIAISILLLRIADKIVRDVVK